MLLDAGAQRVEIESLKMLNDKTMVLQGTVTGQWGDIQIEMIFLNILDAMFGKEQMKQFKAEKPGSYLSLLCNFRNVVISFYCHAEWQDVELPQEFITFMRQNNGNIDKVIGNFAWNQREKCFILKESTLRIHQHIWIHERFNKVVDPMINQLNKLMEHKNNQFIQYIYVIGGFGRNQYVQERLRREYNDFTKYKLDTIIKDTGDPRLSAVEGAIEIIKEEEGENYEKRKRGMVTAYKDLFMDDKHCYECNKVFTSTRKRCGACQRVYFCSAECQKANWKTHKTECKRWRKDIPSEF